MSLQDFFEQLVNFSVFIELDFSRAFLGLLTSSSDCLSSVPFEKVAKFIARLELFQRQKSSSSSAVTYIL